MRRLPAGPTRPGGGCTGPTDRATATRRRYRAGWRLCLTDRPCDGLESAPWCRVAAAHDRRTVRRSPAGPIGPGGGCAGPTDRAMASRRPYVTGWRLRRTNRSRERPPADPAGPVGGCAALTDGWTASRPLRVRVSAAPERPTAQRLPAGPTGTGGCFAGPSDRDCGLPLALQTGLTDRSNRLLRGRLAAAPDPREGLPPALRGRVVAAPHRLIGATTARRPDGAGWRLRQTDRQCDGIPPALRAGGGCAAATDRAAVSRQTYVAG